ncbi:MAG TPA: hypothetical protein VFN19_10140, partial [Candidatus Nanopelagicales bacterium]|nr:hypothetical protein [Candidatus Nanopelagicales bacterium]
VLHYARDTVVRRQVRGAGLQGPAADQGLATGWAVAWEVLRGPSVLTTASPWGVVTVAVRRAVRGEVAAADYGTSARAGWRLRAAGGGPGGTGQTPRPMSLAVLQERGWEPVDPPRQPRSGSALDHVLVAMVEGGWRLEDARAIADWALSRTGCTERTGWRVLAARTGLPPWRARRGLILLAGTPQWPGLVRRVLERGPEVLREAGPRAAIRSTVRPSCASPVTAASRAEQSLRQPRRRSS